MNVADFHYDLPAELIAQFPPQERTGSRLLTVLNDQPFADRWFSDIVDEFRSGDLLVLNNTRVIPARVFGRKDTGGKLEILLERILDNSRFLAQIRASKSPKSGQNIFTDEDQSATLTVTGRQDSFFELEVQGVENLFEWFEKVGHMPLPPYIERGDNQEDQDRYQTVFAEEQGAVAAPTAGLHYDEELLDRIRKKGVRIETVTLHVGAGTYQPVRVDKISDHKMHSEYIDVDDGVCEAIKETRSNGGRVIAVGTTVIRSLETAAKAAGEDLIAPYRGDTDIFIFPGFQFKVVDLLQTNFHLPESTLLMLVSAFAGYDRIMQAYQHAIENRYRFFSYGDAMLLERKSSI